MPFPSSVNVILVPISPGNLIKCVTSSASNLLTATRPFLRTITPQMGSRKHPNSFLCMEKCKIDIYILKKETHTHKNPSVLSSPAADATEQSVC